jgi:hypothetical protein
LKANQGEEANLLTFLHPGEAHEHQEDITSLVSESIEADIDTSSDELLGSDDSDADSDADTVLFGGAEDQEDMTSLISESLNEAGMDPYWNELYWLELLPHSDSSDKDSLVGPIFGAVERYFH